LYFSLFDYMCTRSPFSPWSIAGVHSSQALPGYLLTAPPSVHVPTVIGALAVWIQTQKKNLSPLLTPKLDKKREGRECLATYSKETEKRHNQATQPHCNHVTGLLISA